MFAQFPKKTLFSKIISGLVAVNFILTSVPVKGYASDVVSHSLRDRAGTDTKNFIKELEKRKDPHVRIVAAGIAGIPTPAPVQGVQGLFQFPITENPFINLAAENVIIGGKDAKTIGQNVGRVLTIGQLKELEILNAILGHSANRNVFVEANSKGIKALLKQLAGNKVDDWYFIEGRKESQVKDAIISAFNQVCQRYSEDNKEELGGIDIKVESYVIAAAEKKAAEVIAEAQKKSEKINFAEVIFDALAHFQAREIAAKRFDKIINKRILEQIKQGFKTITLCVGSENKGLPVEAEILAVKKQLDINLRGIDAETLLNTEILLAFEPTSKIGTGNAADPEYIRQVHQAIFDWLAAKYTTEVARVVWGRSFLNLYGGSADDKSIKGIMSVKSTAPEMEGVQLVHGVLFATYGKLVSGFLKIANEVNEAAVRDNASYVCFVNLKAFLDKEKTLRKDYLNAIYAALNRGEINPVRTKLYIADQDTNLRDWKAALNEIHSEFARITSKKASPFQVSGVNDLIPIIYNNGIKQGIAAFDWNMPLDEKGEVEDNEKLVNSIDTLKWFKEESGLQYLYALTHCGRPSGTGYEESFCSRSIVDEARRLFSEEGLGDIEIVLLPYDFTQAKKVIDKKKADTALSGKKVLFVLDNIRMYAAERSEDPAIREQFERAIIALTGEKVEKLIYVYAGFEKFHREKEASIEMGFLLFPRDHIAAGVHEVEEIEVASGFQSRVTGKLTVIGGGKKFDKAKNIADLGKVVGKTGGQLFILGALANPFLADKGINVGKSLMPKTSDELKGFEDGKKKLVENVRDNKLKYSLPVDFVVKDGKQVKETLDVDDMQIDIGPKTIKMIVDHINSLQAGDGLLLNGGAGVFDADWGSKAGTIAIVTAANEAAKRGVTVLFGGGDMVNAVKMVVKETGLQLDPSIYTSTAGGALFVAISKGIAGGLIPVRAVMKFKGDASQRLLNIYSAINDALPGAMVLPITRTPYIDTSVKGNDATREPALDLSKAADGHHIAIPEGRRSDTIKNFYETTWLPVIVTADDMGLMAAENKAAFLVAKKEKDVSSLAQKLIRQALVDKSIPVQDWQERSHQLDPGKLGEAGVDVSSIIGIRTLQNDLLVWIPILVKRGEEAAHLALGQKIDSGLEQSKVKAAEKPFILPQDISIRDHESAFNTIKMYNPLFFDALQKGNLSSVNILINIVNNLDPKLMVDPAAGGIEFNKELGVFVSNKDTDEKATAPGFGKNLERFRGNLYSVGQTCGRLYRLLTPNYDAQNQVGIVIKDKKLQDSVIAFYSRMQRHLLDTAIQYFKDARVFESLRVEIGDYVQRLNKAVRESDALELSQTNAETIINHLTSKGVTLSSAEKLNIESFIRNTGSAGLFDVLQLAALLRVNTFTQSFRHLKLDSPRKVLPSEKPFEAYDGSGRISRTQFAQRLAADISADEEGYTGRYMVASQELKGKSHEEKFNAAMQKVVEMLSDRQIEDAELFVQTRRDVASLTYLVKKGRMTFHAGKEVLAAQLDFQDNDQISSVYPVQINLDGRLIGIVYYVDIAQFKRGLEIELKARQRHLDNIPRPFIVRGQDNEEIFFGLRVDATPGGVEIGDQQLEAAGEKGTVKVGGDTLWKLFAKFNLPEPKGEKLGAADELARIKQIYNQVNETRMPLEGGKQISYVKSQIPTSLLLPGFGSLGRHLGWAIPFVGGAEVMYYMPGSCSTNGASHTIDAIIGLAGSADSVGPTFHMNTSSDKIVEKNPLGSTALKSTGAAKGVALLLSLAEGSQTFFTAQRTPVGLIDGKVDIVGGSMFDLLIRLPNNIPDELIVRYLSRIAEEFPQDIKFFPTKEGGYTWKETIAGQKTGSILYEDFIERVGPGLYRIKVGYDNEMSFGFKENALHEGIYLDALRNRQTAQMAKLFNRALANTADISMEAESKSPSPAQPAAKELSIAKIIPSQTTALGSPTVRLDVVLGGGAKGHFVVPAGTSTGEDEAKTVGVEKAVENLAKIQEEVTHRGLRADQLVEIGQLMLKMGKDGLGAEAMLAYQMAAAWAAANQKGLQPYEFIRELAPDIASQGIPVTKIQYNITNGGEHAENSLDMQELMIVAAGKTTAESNKMNDKIDWNLGLIYRALGLKADPRDKGVGALRGKEGGYKIEDLTLEKLADIYAQADSYKIENLDILTLKEQNAGVHEFVLNCLLAAIQNAGYMPSTSGEAGTVALALDAAATSMLVEGHNDLYNFEGRQITSGELIKIYADWVKKYPIRSIEDGLGENDWEGWMNLIEAVGDDVLVIGDDLLVTQGGRLSEFIRRLKERGFIGANGKVTKKIGILIKLNQNGFLTTGIDDPEKGYLGTLEVIRLAKKHGIKWVVSHRSKEAGPEENEVSIAELAAGTDAELLKSGDHVQATRAVKEDRLAEIDARERAKVKQIEEEAEKAKTSSREFESKD